MTRPIAFILVAATMLVALAVAISERRVSAAFDAVRQESAAAFDRRAADATAAGTAMTRAAVDELEAQANRRLETAEREATSTLRLALLFSATLTLLLGLGLSLRLIQQAKRLATAAERIARGHLDAAVPPSTGALGQLAPAVKRTAAALARRERESEALVALAALPASIAVDAEATDLPAANDAAQLQRLLEDVRRTIAGVLDVRALTLVAVDGERVQRLGTSQTERRDVHYARAGSAVAAMLARGDAIVFDVDRGVHPEDATARAAGARAYAVVPLDAAAPVAQGALVVDLGLCAVAVAELRFLGLVAHELAARLTALQVAGAALEARVPKLGRTARST